MSFSEWKEYKIGEACELFTGFPFKSKEYLDKGNFNVLRGDNVKSGFIFWEEKTRCWNEITETLEKYKLRECDIVIGMDGSRVGKNRAIINKKDLPALLAQRVACIRTKFGFDQTYVSCVIMSKKFEDYVNSIKTGTSIPHISLKQISDFIFNAPSIEEQKAIANILSSLNEKIEINNQINKKLEEMAQAIFKQWFVDFEFPNEDGEPYKSSGGEMVESDMGIVPKGWRYGEISDVAIRIYSGGTPKTSEESYWKGDLPWMSSGETRNNFVISTDKKISKLGAEKSSTKLAYKYNTVIASAGQGFTRGQTSLLLIDTYINQSLITIEPRKNYEFFNYLNIKSRYNELRSISDSHSIRGSLTTKMIGRLPIIVPSEAVVSEFSKLVFLIINKIENNIKETNRLIKIRGALLPKLMSGEIRVPMECKEN